MPNLAVNRGATSTQTNPILYLNLRPFFLVGLSFILFVSPFMRGLYFQPELLTFQMIVAVTFAFCIYDQILHREVTTEYLPWSFLDKAFLALILVYALSLITAVHMRPAIGELLEVVTYFMVYWMASRAIRSERNLYQILIIVYAAGVGVAIIGLLAATGIFNFPGAFDKGVIMSTLQYKNALAIYLAALNVVGLGLSVKSEGIVPKILYAAGNLLMVVVILGTQSRGGWILYPLAMAGFIAMIPRHYLWRAAYHLVIFLGCGLVTARFFYNHLATAESNQLIWYLLYGIAAVIMGQLLYHLLARWINRESVPESTRRLVAIGGVTYLAAVLLVYLSYAASAFPVSVAEFVPSRVISRSQAISRVDPSYVDRMEMNKDALRIVRDHPLTGVGGGGWEALYHSYAQRLYWSSQTHNNFLQTWVEAGSLGFLALVALWTGLVISLTRLRKRNREEWGVLLWSAAIPALAIGVHSVFDFDLSLPAVSVLLFALMGCIRGVTRETVLPQDASDYRTGAFTSATPKRIALIAAGGTLTVLVLFFPSWRFYSAGVAGAEGAKTVNAGKIDSLYQARHYYERAVRLDPYTASYKGDLSQIWAAEAINTKYSLARTNAIRYAEEAVDAEPYNTQIRGILINVYGILGEYSRMEKEACSLVEANPFVMAHHEVLARARLEAGTYYFDQGDHEKARTYMEDILRMPSELPKSTGEPTPALCLSAGQAAYRLGQYDQAINLLAPATQGNDSDLAREARLWLAATYSRQGQTVLAYDLLNQVQKNQQDMIDAYQKLLSMPVLQ